MEIAKSDKIPTQAEYNAMIDDAARNFYSILPKAGFDKETLTDLALSRKNDVEFDKVPVKVRLCVVRLWMAMIPKPEGQKVVDVAEVAAEVIPPTDKPRSSDTHNPPIGQRSPKEEEAAQRARTQGQSSGNGPTPESTDAGND